jgi:PXA domain
MVAAGNVVSPVLHQSEPAPSIASSSSKLTVPSHSTTSLTRRLLFPQLPPTEPVPPLLHTSSTYPALDAELYDLIALALRAYVNPWWTRITRYDKQLLIELTRILSSVLRALEARLLAADLSPLIYHDLPLLITQHCTDYRSAARKVGSSYAAAGSASLAVLFHGQQRHVGISTDGKLDEEYVRAAIDIILKTCLSPEDWGAEAERYLIREVIIKTICIDVAPRITQPWYLHSTLLNLLGPADETLSVSTINSRVRIRVFTTFEPIFFRILWMPKKSPDPPSRNTSRLPSVQNIIVSFLSAVQTISSTALALIQIYKRTVHTIKSVQNSPPTHAPSRPPETTRPPSPPSPDPPPTPRLPSPSESVVASVVGSHASTPVSPSLPPPPTNGPRHNLARPSLLLFAQLLSLPTRFAGAALLFLCDGLISAFAPYLDRYARTHIPTPLSQRNVFFFPICCKRELINDPPTPFFSQPPPTLPLYVYPHAGSDHRPRERHQTRAVSEWLSGAEPAGSDARGTSCAARSARPAPGTGDTRYAQVPPPFYT